MGLPRAAACLLALGCSSSPALPDASSDGAADASSDDAAAPDAAASLCPAGSTLVADRRACPGAVVAPTDAFLNASAGLGDVVSMAGLDEGNLPCAPAVVCAPSDAAKMLFSDDPESPSTSGVLYADTVPAGRYRIYVYHSNGGAAVRKFPVVVLNQGAADAHVTIGKRAVGTPGTDYVAIGKRVAATWLGSSTSDVVTMPAGTRVLLDGALDAAQAAQNELVHAMLDVTTDATLKLSVVSVLATDDAAAITASLPLLPNDGLHDRGTFPGADLIVAAQVTEASSARHVRLGDETTEPDLTGTDATTGAPAKLGGNYGVAYRLTVTSGSAFALAIAPRGGDWGGAVAIPNEPIAQLPSAQSSLGTTTDAVWLGPFGSGTSGMTLVTAGGSNLPIDVVTMTGP